MNRHQQAHNQYYYILRIFLEFTFNLVGFIDVTETNCWRIITRKHSNGGDDDQHERITFVLYMEEKRLIYLDNIFARLLEKWWRRRQFRFVEKKKKMWLRIKRSVVSACHILQKDPHLSESSDPERLKGPSPHDVV